MHRVVFSYRANLDFDKIFFDIAQRGFPENAERFVDAIYFFCLGLRLGPHRGTKRPAVGRGVRTVGYKGRITIVFKVGTEEETVTILRILRRGQSLEKVFKH